MVRVFARLSNDGTAPGRRAVLLGAVATVFAGASRVVAVEAHPLIRVVGDDRASVFSRLDENAHYVGMLESALGVINRDLGWRFEYVSFPWKRAQEYVRSGTMDAFCTAQTTERRGYARFAAKPLFTLDSGWLHYSADNPRAAEIARISSIDQLKRFRIGVERGASWPNVLFEAGWQTTEVEDALLLDGMVRAGRIDLFFKIPELMPLSADGTARSLLPKLHVAFLPGARIEFFFGLRSSYPDSDRLIAEFDRAQARCEQSGELSRALAEYQL